VTRTIPPPLILENNALSPAPSDLLTATATSPLLHSNFGSPKSLSSDSNNSLIRSPMSAVFDFRGSGAASALRQKIESGRGIGSPLPSPLRSTASEERMSERSFNIVIGEREGVPEIRDTHPQPPTSPAVSHSSTTSEKSKRGAPPPLVVMNPAPPPPYTPMSLPSPVLSPTLIVTSTPSIPPSPSQAVAEPPANTSPTSLFLPHPNAPKPNLSPQGPLYGRTMASVPSPSSTLLLQTMRKAAQMRVGPNGLPRFSSIYGSTVQELSTALGPVYILFSVDPPNYIPANRTRMVPVAAPPLVPVSTSQNALGPTPGVQQLPALSQVATPTPNVVPQSSLVPKTRAMRPRSRSFSDFGSPTSTGRLPKEQRLVLHLTLCF
jgi:hypothetical protein